MNEPKRFFTHPKYLVQRTRNLIKCRAVHRDGVRFVDKVWSKINRWDDERERDER
jgi:hypothetical protein